MNLNALKKRLDYNQNKLINNGLEDIISSH